MIKAFIFDLDGVIADTDELHYRSWKQLADEENMPFTREDNHALRGVDRYESLRRFLKGHSVSDAVQRDYMARKQHYFMELLAEFTAKDTQDGVRELIIEARTRGLKIGLGSASRNAHQVLTQLELFHLFDAIGDGYTVKNTKPAPDVFLWTAGRLGVTPFESVIFEDSESGIQAGITGGFYTVGIGQANTRQAHWQLPSLANITVDAVLEQATTT